MRQLDLLAVSEDWDTSTVTNIKEWSDGYIINVSVELAIDGADDEDTYTDAADDSITLTTTSSAPTVPI